MDAPPISQVLTVTPAALRQVNDLRAGEPDSDRLGLWVEVTGSRGGDYTYDLAFEQIDNVPSDADISLHGDLTVVVPAGSIEQLSGATLDVPAAEGQTGLVLRNPNRPAPVAPENLELTGDLPDKVNQLLQQMINPSLGAHGGYAELVGVEGSIVYITMGGGCHGCAASALTLRAGIRRTIIEHLPEVTDVVDATDHSAGENPFM